MIEPVPVKRTGFISVFFRIQVPKEEPGYPESSLQCYWQE